MKQTAVNWLEKQIEDHCLKYGTISFFLIHSMIQQAKEMEKRQIIDARVAAPLLSTFDKADYKEEAEQYYAETYGK